MTTTHNLALVAAAYVDAAKEAAYEGMPNAALKIASCTPADAQSALRELMLEVAEQVEQETTKCIRSEWARNFYEPKKNTQIIDDILEGKK